MRDEVVGAQPQRLPVALARRLELAPGVARGAEIVPRFREPRMQPQRAAIAGDRLAQPAAVLQRVAEIAVKRRDAGVALDRAPQRRFCGLGLSAAQADNAEDMQGLGFASVLN